MVLYIIPYGFNLLNPMRFVFICHDLHDPSGILRPSLIFGARLDPIPACWGGPWWTWANQFNLTLWPQWLRESRPHTNQHLQSERSRDCVSWWWGEKSLLTLYGSKRQGAQRTVGSPVVLQWGSWNQGRSGAEMEKESFFLAMSSSHWIPKACPTLGVCSYSR